MKIPNCIPSINSKELDYLKECIKTKWLSSTGPLVREFENKISKFTGSKYAVALSSGTSALQLAIKVLNPNYGDEVLMPSLSFIATANSIIYNNCSPVFFDVDKNFNIDLFKLEKFLNEETYFKNGNTFNKKTKKKIIAVIVVAVWGGSTDLYKLKNLLHKRNIVLIEDAAEAFGSFLVKKNKKKHLGTFGLVGCLSFNLNKIITTGGGGAIITNNKSVAKKIKYLSLQAKDNSERWIHNNIGYNFGLSNMHAAVGISQIKKIHNFLKQKKKIYHKYHLEVKKHKNFEMLSYPNNVDPNYWMNILLIKNKKVDAKFLLRKFKKKGIEAKHVWLPCHKQKMFKNYQKFKINRVNKLHKYSLLMPSSSNLELKNIRKILKILNTY